MWEMSTVSWVSTMSMVPRKAKRAVLIPPKIFFACFPSSPRGKRWCVGFVSSRRAQVLACLFLSLNLAEQRKVTGLDYSSNRTARSNFLIGAESKYRFFSSKLHIWPAPRFVLSGWTDVHGTGRGSRGRSAAL